MLITSLKNQKEFDLVNKVGTKFPCPYFLTIIVKNSPKVIAYMSSKKGGATLIDQTVNRFYFGMKVGKKLGNAVVRNKIKRRIRHLIRLLVNNTGNINTQVSHKKIIPQKNIIAPNNWAIIIIPRKNFEQIEFATLLSVMKQSLLSV